MIIFTLVFIISLLSLLQDKKRRMTAHIFVLMTLIHTVLWSKQPDNGYLYFLSSAINDLMIILVIANLKYITKLTENLMKISFCFIIVNSLGWIMWMAYLDLFIYQYAAMLLYMWTIVVLLNWDGIEDGNYKMDRWTDCLRVHNYTGLHSNLNLPVKE